jgi:hydroxymethylbilane synthase
VTQGELDGVTLAAAGLNRLGLKVAGSVLLPFDLCLPAPGQGALAIQSRDEEGWVLEAVHHLHDPGTASCVEAERAFLEELGGGCLVPAGALAEERKGRLRLQAVVADPDGERLVRVEVEGDPAAPEKVGLEAAREAAAGGGAGIVAAIREGSGA